MFCESLEARRMLAATTAPFGSAVEPTFSAHVTKTGSLLVQGTRLNDQILVTMTPPKTAVAVQIPPVIHLGDRAGAVYVKASNNVGVSITSGYDLSLGIRRIVIDGGAGNDDLRIDSNVKLKAILIGGKGNDILIGGPLGDVLSGGPGNDSLEAAITS